MEGDMKVRHKRGHEVYEVVDESPEFYIAKSYLLSDHAIFALPKSEYKPVPTETPRVPVVTWRDVTGECRLDADGDAVWHEGKSLFVLRREHVVDGYRLRHVRLCWRESLDAHYRGDYQDAFIVEKRNG
jgi:hypothetical protein